MQIVHRISELRQTINALKREGKVTAFVPTMGNLHQGHLQLVARGLSEADFVICSIFVNPLQFGEGEDYDKYPQTLDADVKKLQAIGCHLVFAPSADEMYPQSHSQGRDQTRVQVPGISDILEGASRPGHFDGVATIVAKLFNMVQPDKAIFGEKDYQQLLLIRRMVRELCFPVAIISHAIVREDSGLAMSSRNGYLDERQRQQAAAIYELLSSLASRIKGGARDYRALEQEATEDLNEQGFVTDYIQILAADLSVPSLQSRHLVILAAASLGTTRLLDNVQVIL